MAPCFSCKACAVQFAADFLARAENSSGHAVWPAVRSGEQPARAGKPALNGYRNPVSDV